MPKIKLTKKAEGFKTARRQDNVRQIISALYDALSESERQNVYVGEKGYNGPNGEVLQWLHHGVERFYEAFIRGGDKDMYIKLNQYALEDLIKYLNKNVPGALVQMGKFAPYCMTRETIEANFDKFIDALR